KDNLHSVWGHNAIEKYHYFSLFRLPEHFSLEKSAILLSKNDISPRKMAISPRRMTFSREKIVVKLPFFGIFQRRNRLRPTFVLRILSDCRIGAHESYSQFCANSRGETGRRSQVGQWFGSN